MVTEQRVAGIVGQELRKFSMRLKDKLAPDVMQIVEREREAFTDEIYERARSDSWLQRVRETGL